MTTRTLAWATLFSAVLWAALYLVGLVVWRVVA